MEFAVYLADRRMIWSAKVAITDGPVACRAEVRVRAARVDLWHPMESLEVLGQIDSGLRYLNHDRTRSNTRPRNQKFSTPAHSA